MSQSMIRDSGYTSGKTRASATDFDDTGSQIYIPLSPLPLALSP